MYVAHWTLQLGTERLHSLVLTQVLETKIRRMYLKGISINLQHHGEISTEFLPIVELLTFFFRMINAVFSVQYDTKATVRTSLTIFKQFFSNEFSFLPNLHTGTELKMAAISNPRWRSSCGIRHTNTRSIIDTSYFFFLRFEQAFF